MEEQVASNKVTELQFKHMSGALLPTLYPGEQIGIISSDLLIVFPGALY